MEPKPEPTMGPQLPPEQMGMDPSMGQPQPLLPPSAALDAGALPGLLMPQQMPPMPPNMQPGY